MGTVLRARPHPRFILVSDLDHTMVSRACPRPGLPRVGPSQLQLVDASGTAHRFGTQSSPLLLAGGRGHTTARA